MTARLLSLVSLALLTGCVDFVDPAGLNLAEDTRLNISLSLSDLPFAVCPGDGPLQPVRTGGTATLCVDATLFVGRDKYGDRVLLASDTLWALGVPLVPEIQPQDSLRVYRAAFRFPVHRMADTLYTVRFPRVAGIDLPVRELRWVAVEPTGPDTLRVRQGEGAVLGLELPVATPFPQPSQFWTVTLAGAANAAQYQGQGRPRASYEFPAPVLDALGGNRFAAGFRWQQSFGLGLSQERVQISAFFVENLSWTVLPDTVAAQ